jgi:hypothetical protein
MEFYVFDLNFNRFGIVDNFKEVQITKSYDSLGQLTMTIEGTKEIVDLLQTDRILVKTTELSKGYIIKTREYLDEKSSELQIIAPSLNVILNDRLVLGQQEFSGTIEAVMKSFVAVNCINPTNSNRKIPNLVLSENRGINIITTEGTKNEPLCDYLYELCKKHDVSFDVLLDHTNKKFVFDVWQGTNRSTEQDLNPHIIFAKEFENVIKQDYTESIGDLKTTAVVLGEETDTGQTIVTVNDDKTGFDRKEILVESTDVRKTYRDENGNEITLTDSEYRVLLEEAGKNTLSEYQPIRTFESEADPLSNFVYGVDYFIGDKVSVRNDELGIILHTRIIKAVEKEDKNGESIELNFGNNIPSFIEKIKRR